MKTANINSRGFVTKDHFDKTLHSLDDRIMTKLDGIVKELEEMREDSTLGAYQTREHEQGLRIMKSDFSN